MAKENYPKIKKDASIHPTETEYPLYEEYYRNRGDSVIPMFDREQSGGLSDAPDDGGPRAVPSPPAKLR